MRRARFALAAMLAVWTAETQAQTPPPAPPPAQAAAQVQVPPADTLRILIRTTLVALNHANQTGNYTVLRDLGAPGFQSANSAARLGEIFAGLRTRNLDFGPLVVVEPKLVRPAAIEQEMLRITGFFPTSPEQVNFDLIFAPVDGRWRLFGMAANTTPAEAADKPGPQAAKPAAAEKPKPDTAKAKPDTAPKPSAAKPQDKKPASVAAPPRQRDSTSGPPGALATPPKP